MIDEELRKNDVRIKSWNHLVEVLYAIPRSDHARHRSDFVYRGLADESWALETSLMRLGAHYVDVERPLLRAFRKYAPPGEVPADQILVQLTVAQHHGLPTRLIDWTVSPQIAVHFATAEEEHFDKDAVIWCVNVAEAHTLLPRRLLKILEAEYAFLFSVEMLQDISSLDAFDALAQDGEFVLFFEPPSLDARIVNQWAIMSVTPDPALILNEFLRAHPTLYRRVIIPSKLKWEVRDKLDQGNVTERMLFPGLDGLSRWLKRYYGAGPNKNASATAS